MEALFKKYFWVVNLVALSIVAWLTAQTIIDWAAARYLTIQPESAVLAAQSESAPMLEKAPGEEIGSILVERSPFNVEVKPDEKPPEDPDCKPDCTGKSCGDDGCGEDCGTCEEGRECNAEGQCEAGDDEPKESELPIELVGTMAHPTDPDMRFAHVKLNGSNSSVVGVGSDVLGKALVVDILPKMIYLREGDNLTYRALWAEAPAKAQPPTGSRVRPGQLRRPNPSTSAPQRPVRTPNRGMAYDYSQGVRKVSEFQFEIDKQMLDEQLTDLTQLGMQARVIPNYRRGKYEGFKLVGVRPGSLYRAIGIRSGDIVRSINGKAINSPNKAMELFTQLKNSSAINLEVERRGKLEAFNYTIK